MLIVPLRSRREVVGLMTFVQTSDRRPLELADVAHAERIARRAGPAADVVWLLAAGTS